MFPDTWVSVNRLCAPMCVVCGDADIYMLLSVGVVKTAAYLVELTHRDSENGGYLQISQTFSFFQMRLKRKVLPKFKTFTFQLTLSMQTLSQLIMANLLGVGSQLCSFHFATRNPSVKASLQNLLVPKLENS